MNPEMFSSPEQGNGAQEKKKTIFEKLRSKAKMLMATGIISISGASLYELYKETHPRPEDYIEFVEKARGEILSEKEKTELKEQVEYLKNEYPATILYTLEKADELAKEQRAEMAEVPRIGGFEALDLNNKELEEMWIDNYPKGTIAESVRAIRYEDKTSESEVKLYGLFQAHRAATTTPQNEIVFFRYAGEEAQSKQATLESLDFHFAHELGHANDWERNTTLSPEERAQFLYEITKAFKEPLAFEDTSGYVESIESGQYRRVREWWAELCETYFSSPEDFKKLSNEKEYELVVRWMQRYDPEFDSEVARAEREKFFARAAENRLFTIH